MKLVKRLLLCLCGFWYTLFAKKTNPSLFVQISTPTDCCPQECFHRKCYLYVFFSAPVHGTDQHEQMCCDGESSISLAISPPVNCVLNVFLAWPKWVTTLAVLTQRIKAQPAHSQAPVTAQPWKEAAFQPFFSCSTLLRLSGAFFRPGF